MGTSPATRERATHRTVILLRPSEKQQLERLAAKENISSAEAIRRLIRAGETVFRGKQEEEVVEAALKLISNAAHESNEAMTRMIEKLDTLHEELAQREIP